MPRSNHTRLSRLSAFLALLVVAQGSAPDAARAAPLPMQDCAAALQQAADDISALPSSTPSEVNDQLQLDYDAAQAATSPAACMAIVLRMNEVVRRYRVTGSADGAGGAGLGARRSGQGSDRAAATPAPSAGQIAREDVEERRRERLERATQDQNEDVSAVAAYGEAFAAYRLAIHAVAKTVQPQPELGSVDKPIAEIGVIIERMENDIIVNDNVDALHARLEDAFRRIDELRKAADRASERFRAAKAAKEAAESNKPGDDPLLGPLVPLRFYKNYKVAEERYLQAARRLAQAEFAAKQARNKIDRWIHWYQPFLDMKPGYKQAYDAAYARHAEEQESVRNKCDNIALSACVQLTRTTNERQKRELDGIFNSYVIRQ
ncbi:hypothetical protein [Sphingomonas sp. OTU376]|uniref:hypothetical protein n=1 Tax=Sphingomonas sp. OTU376 TaxID=3043863 RepID=UPI00313DE481